MRFLGDVPPAANLFDLTRQEVGALLLELFGKVSSLEAKLGEQREEIARLKGLKGRPAIKLSGMDKGTEPPKPAGHVKPRFRGKVRPFVEIKDEVIQADIPPGSVFNHIGKSVPPYRCRRCELFCAGHKNNHCLKTTDTY